VQQGHIRGCGRVNRSHLPGALSARRWEFWTGGNGVNRDRIDPLFSPLSPVRFVAAPYRVGIDLFPCGGWLL
jgi:hypothetical protein